MSTTGTSIGRNKYLILYLTPSRLYESHIILKLQAEALKTYVEDIAIPILCNHEIDRKIEAELTAAEKIFSGLINTSSAHEKDVMGKVASLWYFFTKKTHASLGPRIGKFVEDLVRELARHWITSKSGSAGVIESEVNPGDFFKRYFNIALPTTRMKVDFAVYKGNTVSLVELRTSEHTGGRTSQQSLLDKFDWILDMLESNSLRASLIGKGIEKLELAIAILFSEEDKELLNRSNYSRGRHTSLVKYIVDNRHIGSRIENLVKAYGYEISYDGGRKFENSFSLKKLESAFTNVDTRKIILKKDAFILEIAILWGDEFFIKYAGSNFDKLIKSSINTIADDLWIFLTVTLNELKLMKEFGRGAVERVYRFIRSSNDLYKRFLNLYRDPSINSIEAYMDRLNSLFDEIAKEFVNNLPSQQTDFRPLETNDMTAQYIYVVQAVIVALAMMLYSQSGYACLT